MPPAPPSPKVNWMKGPAAEIKNTKVNATFCFTRHLSGSKSKLLKVHCFKRQGGHRVDISTILLHRGWDLVHPFHGYCDGIWWQSDGMDDDVGSTKPSSSISFDVAAYEIRWVHDKTTTIDGFMQCYLIEKCLLLWLWCFVWNVQGIFGN